jgi:hypothetical protein
VFQRWLFWPLFAAIMGFVVGGSFVWAIDHPNDQQHISYSNSSANADGDQDKPTKTFGEALSIIWNRTWDDPVAFYTFVLAIFTALLAIVSSTQIVFLIRTDKTARIAAEAADRSAKAIAVVEQAYVYPVIIAHGAIEECIRNALVFYEGDHTKDDVPTPETAEITFQFKNFGKTPAILKSAFVAFGVPPHGALIGIAIAESVLASLEETGPLNSQMLVGINRKQAQHILVHTGHICFEGDVTFDDIWGNEHTTEFYFKWDIEIRRMALQGVRQRPPKHSE